MVANCETGCGESPEREDRAAQRRAFNRKTDLLRVPEDTGCSAHVGSWYTEELLDPHDRSDGEPGQADLAFWLVIKGKKWSFTEVGNTKGLGGKHILCNTQY